MNRIVKEPEVRRAEIIASAKKLFEKHGYTNTPVEAIIQEAGVAKGTFYYYFNAKKDILDALVQQVKAEMLKYFESIVAMENLTAIQKLKLMLRGDEKKSQSQCAAMKYIHRPENRELQEQLNIQIIEIFAPLIAKVLEQGNKEGIFNVTAPLESTQLLLASSQFILDSGLFNWKAKKRALFLQALQKMFEQTVGATQGTFDFISEE